MSQGFDPVGAAFHALMIYIPLLFSLCFHEFAHGWVAKKRGDLTAQLMGRLTLNPMAHADPIGTFALPLAMLFFGLPMFGWGKPVPVNELNLKKPRIDMFWIALAGPSSNIILAVVGAFLGALFAVKFSEFGISKAAVSFSIVFVQINLFLAFFNLIPLHPLDGGKIIARFLPEELNHKLESNMNITSIILLLLFASGGLAILFRPLGGIGEFLFNVGMNIVSRF